MTSPSSRAWLALVLLGCAQGPSSSSSSGGGTSTGSSGSAGTSGGELDAGCPEHFCDCACADGGPGYRPQCGPTPSGCVATDPCVVRPEDGGTWDSSSWGDHACGL